MNYNKVILGGRLTRDIELKHTSGNQAVATVGIAVNRKYKTAGGEQREDVLFMDCEAWGKTAETMAQYLRKGSGVLIDGRLKMDEWEDKQTGQKRTKVKVNIENFSFTDPASGNGAPGPIAAARAATTKNDPIQKDEDIPF